MTPSGKQFLLVVALLLSPLMACRGYDSHFVASPFSLRSIRLAGRLSASPIRPWAATFFIIHCTLCLVKAGMTRKFPFWGSLNSTFWILCECVIQWSWLVSRMVVIVVTVLAMVWVRLRRMGIFFCGWGFRAIKLNTS